MYVDHLERSMYRRCLESYHTQRDKHPPPTQAACSLHIYRTKISNRSLVSVSGLSIRVDFLDQCKTVRSIKSNQIKSNR